MEWKEKFAAAGKELLAKAGESMLRIVAALAIISGIAALGYWLWQPGSYAALPAYSNNAIWLGHGWLGDDGWFVRNERNKDDFRSAAKISALFKKLAENKISTVYPHLCPAQMDGKIAPYDSVQIERFLDFAGQYNIEVIPWVGGVFEESARPADENWCKNFADSVAELLDKHPRLAGVQVNIEPMPSGNRDFLQLLEELQVAVQGRTLSVAAYPPPTKWHQFPDVHWEDDYMRQVAERCSQLAVMMYDTAIPLEKFYIKLMRDWTTQLAKTTHSTGCELLLGIPAYEDAGVSYHKPEVENLQSALQGISGSSWRFGADGIAIYCEWEMDDAKWRIWRRFIR